MAKQIQAIREFGPRIELARTISSSELAQHIASRTSLNRGEISNVLNELNEAVTTFACQGTAVKIDGLGIFTPSIGLTGRFRVGVRLDRSVGKVLNVPGAFNGKILNRTNIGKTVKDLIKMWNDAYPNDKIG